MWSNVSFVTVRNEVAKVMFLQVCVCPRGGGLLLGVPCPRGSAPGGGVPGSGGCLVLGGGIPACTEADPSRRDGYCCGRYASYWNAFLLVYIFEPFPTSPATPYIVNSLRSRCLIAGSPFRELLRPTGIPRYTMV